MNDTKHILVTGGAGYIGSHTVVELLQRNYAVTIVDNFSNSSRETVQRIEQITGKQVDLHELDIRDQAKICELVASKPFEAVMHFVALKAVGESVEHPLWYYDNNVNGTIALCKALDTSSVTTFIFSSSATVYGNQPIPYTETTPRDPENPYGRTKFITELLMADIATANPNIAMIALRYFNPIGAHPSGLIGENPDGVPNNLMPFVAQVASGKRKKLSVFGGDYPTKDGTGVRDYIHVVDLARGHVAALEKSRTSTGFKAYNLGSGHGESVLDLVHAFEAASGQHIPYEIAARRPGDLAEYYASADLAARELGWKAELSLHDACVDTWRWQQQNPNGYNKEKKS